MRKARESGMSLVEVVVAAAVLGVVTMGILKFQNSVIFRASGIEKDADLDTIRGLLIANAACEEMMAGVDPNASCGSTSGPGAQTGPFLPLRVKTGKGSVRDFGAYAGGVTTYGGWSLRTSCSNAEGTLVVRAARVTGGGGFFKDPTTDITYDWDHRPALFGVSLPLCARAFKAPPAEEARCADNEFSVGLNADLSPMCRPFPVTNCPAYHVVSGYKPNAAGGIDPICTKQTFGGAYSEKVLANYDATDAKAGTPKTWSIPNCIVANPYTGSCTCPPGFVPFTLFGSGQPIRWNFVMNWPEIRQAAERQAKEDFWDVPGLYGQVPFYYNRLKAWPYNGPQGEAEGGIIKNGVVCL